MKKTTGIILKVLGGTIILLLLLMFLVPVLFKDKIRVKVEESINSSVNASVKFTDYSLGFFRHFPDLTFTLSDLSIVGTDKFKGDTLASFRSINLIFNLASIFGKSGYEVKSILMDKGTFNIIYLKDGSANYDIMKDTATSAAPETSSSSGMKILLKKVALTNSSLSYIDKSADMQAYLNGLNASLTGDLTGSTTDLKIGLHATDLTFVMEGTKYLDRTLLDSKIDMSANLDSMKFTFRENYLSLNDLRVNFAGTVRMPKEDIITDITFKSETSTLKSLLSLMPAVYMKDYQDLKTSGDFAFSGFARGVYSDADSTLPDVRLDLSVSNGMVSYPALPEQIRNISMVAGLFYDGKVTDKTTLDISKFHMELAGNPFDMTFSLRTPVSDPDFNGSMKGRIDLGALMKAVPMDSIHLAGLIDMSFAMAGRMSMLEAKKYESFKASGSMNVKNMIVAMTGYPEVKIEGADFEFSPAYASLANTRMTVGGKSDFSLDGRIENYIPWLFSDKTIKGTLSMHSKLTDLSDIMSKMATDTTIAMDTTSLSVVRIPKNIDFDFDALIDQLIYNKIKVQQLKGHIIARDGVLSIKDAGMDLLGGKIAMNADYDTRDSLKPVVKTDLSIESLGIRDAFNSFNTVQQLAPTAKGLGGRFSAKLTYSSLLGKDMMPLIKTISGNGKLQSDEVTLLESVTFDKMKEALKLGEKYNNVFRDVNVSFKIADGRIFVTPFNVKTGNLKMNIGGDQGLDQTLNYVVRTELPRADLGSSVNSLIDNLSAQASSFGISFKPSETLKINVKVSGTFTKPVVTPFFGENAPETASGSPSGAAKEVAKQAVDNTVDQARQKAKAEAEAEGARLIKEAEEKGQQLRDEATKAADAIRKEADAQGKNLIEAAKPKGQIALYAAQKSAESLKKNADVQAEKLIREADTQANKLVEEAKAKSAELTGKI